MLFVIAPMVFLGSRTAAGSWRRMGIRWARWVILGRREERLGLSRTRGWCRVQGGGAVAETVWQL